MRRQLIDGYYIDRPGRNIFGARSKNESQHFQASLGTSSHFGAFDQVRLQHRVKFSFHVCLDKVDLVLIAP